MVTEREMDVKRSELEDPTAQHGRGERRENGKVVSWSSYGEADRRWSSQSVRRQNKRFMRCENVLCNGQSM